MVQCSAMVWCGAGQCSSACSDVLLCRVVLWSSAVEYSGAVPCRACSDVVHTVVWCRAVQCSAMVWCGAGQCSRACSDVLLCSVVLCSSAEQCCGVQWCGVVDAVVR
jgi:hypothetical protein